MRQLKNIGFGSLSVLQHPIPYMSVYSKYHLEWLCMESVPDPRRYRRLCIQEIMHIPAFATHQNPYQWKISQAVVELQLILTQLLHI